MSENKIPTIELLFNYAMYTERTLKNRIIAFVCEQRPPPAIMGVPIVIGSATLALGHLPSLAQLVKIIVSAYLIVSGMHVINDVVDAERDKRKWPTRAVPTGLIKRSELAAYGTGMAATGTFLAYYWFTWQCAFFATLVLILGTIQTRYLRDNIGYQTVIWIPAFMPVGAWAAFAPETLFTPLPWLLFLFLMVHQIGMMAAAEPRALVPEVRPFLIKPSPRNETMLYMVSAVLMLVVGIVIYFSTTLHWIYLAALFGLTAFSVISGAPMIRDPMSVENVKKALRGTVNYNIVYWLALAFAIV